MNQRMRFSRYPIISLFLLVVIATSAWSIDCEETRRTLSGIQGVNVVIEGLQPDIREFAQKFGLERDRVKADVEIALRKAGIGVLTYDQWLKTAGRPFFYVVINTHQHEKYWYAYDVRVEIRQGVLLEQNTSIVTMAATWSVNMTGITNVGKLGVLKDKLNMLVVRFIDAYISVNRVKTQ